MCITKFINSILSNYFNNKYYTYNFNEMIYDFNLTITIVSFKKSFSKLTTIVIDTFKKSFSKLPTVYDNTNKTECKQVVHMKECLKYPDPKRKKEKITNMSQKMYRQTIYHNLTYNHGIFLLN